jgi:hypothetical protein
MSQKEITFSTIEIGAVPAHLLRCDECRSLLLKDDAQEHANWHGKLRSEVSMASLGFGGTGL